MDYAHPKPATCTHCPARQWCQGYVPASIPNHPVRIAFIGQGPGEQEAMYGTPFYENAPAGWRLRRWIRRAGGNPSDYYFDNIVRGWFPKGFTGGKPYGNREPTPQEAAYCWSVHGAPALLGAGPAWVVPVGGPAARTLADLGGERFIGTVHWRSLEQLTDSRVK